MNHVTTARSFSQTNHTSRGLGLFSPPRKKYSISENKQLTGSNDSLIFDDQAVDNVEINNPNLMKKMGEESRKFAEKRFNIKDVINTHMKIYNKMLKQIKYYKI